MATTVSKTPGYREPWTNGAKAYPEADTPEALLEGAKRKRKAFMLHLSHEGFGDMPCVKCGIALADPYPASSDSSTMHTDKWGTGHYSPKSKSLVVAHYYCSWNMLMNAVMRLGRIIG